MKAKFTGRVNLNSVGVPGHSLGGATAVHCALHGVVAKGIELWRLGADAEPDSAVSAREA